MSANVVIDIGLILCKTNGVLPKKELTILELLVAKGPMYGLQLVEHSGGALKRGTVYVTLRRMESKGLVTSEQEARQPGAIGLPRRIYRPTPLGERMLRAWATFTHEVAWEVKP
jgi:DNA-binding PadR family transcriptional regulator